MKGIDVAIADPIPPVTKFDKRPSVKFLIEENCQSIDEVKRDLQTDPLYDTNKHDDLWILRFLMSHKKKPKAAAKAAKTTLVFRKEDKLDEGDIRAYPVGQESKSEGLKRYLKYCTDDALSFVVPDPQRGVIVFFVLAGMDQHQMVKNVDGQDWLPSFFYLNEWSHQWVDYVTRTTGRLTKSVQLADTKGISLGGINSGKCRRDGKVIGIMEDCYPQMLQGTLVCNAPAWAQIPWRICRPLLPKRMVQKIDFVNSAKNEKERKRLFAYISEEHLPARFGGKNEAWPADFPPPLVG